LILPARKLSIRAGFPVAKALLSNALPPTDKTMAVRAAADPRVYAAIGPKFSGSIMSDLAQSLWPAMSRLTAVDCRTFNR
jgi:hypothetical protein